MPIVFSVPILVIRLLPLIIYHVPSSGYFDEIIRSVGGLSTDPLCGYHDLCRTFTLGIEKNLRFRSLNPTFALGGADPLSGIAATPVLIPIDNRLQPHQVALPTQA